MVIPAGLAAMYGRGRTVGRDAVAFTDTFATPDTKLYELVEK